MVSASGHFGNINIRGRWLKSEGNCETVSTFISYVSQLVAFRNWQ
jgi:hypothetical protein